MTGGQEQQHPFREVSDKAFDMKSDNPKEHEGAPPSDTLPPYTMHEEQEGGKGMTGESSSLSIDPREPSKATPRSRRPWMLDCVKAALVVSLLLMTAWTLHHFLSQIYHIPIEPPHRTVFDVIVSDPRFREFTKVLAKRKGLRDDFGDLTRTFTVWVPVNEAFEGKVISMSESDIDQMIRYQTLNFDYPITEAKNGDLLDTTLRLKSLDNNPQKIYVTRVTGQEGNKRAKKLLGGLKWEEEQEDNEEVEENERAEADKKKKKKKHEEMVFLNDFVEVVEGDLMAVNGRIHAIKPLLNPPGTVQDILQEFPVHLSTSLVALEQTSVLEKIHGPVTLFVPGNEAWRKLDENKRLYLFSPRGVNLLDRVMRYHVVPSRVSYHTSFPSTEECSFLPTLLEDQEICVQTQASESKHKHQEKEFVLDGHSVINIEDLISSEGVVHVVDEVLIPVDVEEELSEAMESFEEAGDEKD